MALLLIIGVAAARDRISTNVADLPQAAQQFISRHFPKVKVNHIKIDDKSFGRTEYDVVLDNGTQIDFNSKGEWRDVECGYRAVPDEIVMPEIRKYVAANYSNAKIVTIEKDDGNYNIQLNSGLELEFNRAGQFLRIDD